MRPPAVKGTTTLAKTRVELVEEGLGLPEIERGGDKDLGHDDRKGCERD
jgi:hypothetical protein